MRASNDATRRSIEIAAEALEFSNGNFDRTMRQMANQTAAQFGALQESQKSIELTHQQIRLDQRAWVVPSETVADKASGGTYFKVTFKNSGHTPALRTHAWIGTTPGLSKVPNADPIRKKDPVDSFALAPGGTGNTSTPTFTDAEIEPIRHGARFYIYGTVAYADVFGKNHWSQFCFYPGLDLKGFGPCSKHNTTDDAPKK